MINPNDKRRRISFLSYIFLVNRRDFLSIDHNRFVCLRTLMMDVISFIQTSNWVKKDQWNFWESELDNEEEKTWISCSINKHEKERKRWNVYTWEVLDRSRNNSIIYALDRVIPIDWQWMTKKKQKRLEEEFEGEIV